MRHVTDAYASWQHRVADKMRLSKYPFLRDLLAELIGTIVFVVFATGVAAQSFLTEGSIGEVMEVSAGYGAAWGLGLFVAGPRTPGMCNPTIAFANALIGRLDFLRMLAFWLVELLGSIIGALLVLAIYWEKVWDYTVAYDNRVLNMDSTGVIFTSTAKVSNGDLCINQLITGMFAIMAVMAILDQNNWNLPYFYVIIYAVLAQFIQVNDFSVQTTSIINPAFDFGGRIALAMVGKLTKFEKTHESKSNQNKKVNLN